eukprot:3972228-Pyramimonas_sp.AAC.1
MTSTRFYLQSIVRDAGLFTPSNHRYRAFLAPVLRRPTVHCYPRLRFISRQNLHAPRHHQRSTCAVSIEGERAEQGIEGSWE